MVILQLEEQPPLIQAVFAGEIEQAKNLLEHKEDVNYQDYEKRSALHAAAFRGDAGMAKLLIDHGARVNTKDSKWLTPLHRACSSGSEETVSVLLGHSADTSARDRQWQTPLHIAAAHNALECVSSLLDKVPNPNVTDRSGRTALHHAVLNGHNDIVELLILKGCVVNACDKKDCRPMHWAAHMGHVDTIELLLRNGADINARDRNLYTPLHVAAASGMVSACRILLSYGADVDSQNAYGNTPLHIACLNGHVPVCQELVSNGCDKEALNYRGQTPLHIAAASTHGVHCLNYLVSLRVNINKQSLDGRTPLHMTAIHGRFTRSKTLIDRGAIVDCVDKNGCTALHIAAQHGHELLSNTLLSYGADASKKGHDGRTALHMCCLSGYVECCRTFIKAGVDINAQDDSGKTPTHCASYKGSVECLDLLVSSGADFKASDNIGRTALHYAAVQGYFDCVFTLVGIGSSVNQADNEGCTALHLAAAYDLEGRCVDYLIQHKADPRLKDKNGFTSVHYAVAGNNLCGLRYLLDSCGSAYLLFGHDMPSTTPLHLAAKNGNMEILEKLMPYFPDPNIKTEHGCTPLLLAARESFANCVQLLLRFGAKVSICDSVYNMSPVHHSAKNGHVHCLALLVDNTEDKTVIDLPDKLQRTALMLAVSNSHSDCVLTLIKSGADPNIVDSDFHSCLFRSVVTGQHNILQMLLPRSSTLNKPDVNGKTVLHIAAACGRMACLQRILHYMDRNVAASQDNQNFTALHWACYSGSFECVEHLLKEGIFKKLEGNPFSAVHCATAAGSEKCLTLLCTYFGADVVKLRDARNRTPLHIAALHGRMECALYLLQQGAEIECQDEDGRTPLIAAAQNGQVQVIEVLISYKADMTSFDKNGNTALHLACLQKHNHAALLLLEYTDDPSIINMANNDRKTPLHLSARNGLVDVTRQLILKGSSVIAVDSNGLTPALCCAPNPSVAQCLAIILASYPGLTTNNKKALLMNTKLFKTDEKTSTNSQTEISLVKNPDQFELEQMFEVKFQPDSDLKYSKEELLCLTSSIVQNFFEGKHSKKQRRKIISDTSCFIVENYEGNDDSFAEKPTATFGRDLHKSQSDMTLTTKTIYSEEDYGRIIQSARPKEENKGKKIVLACPHGESKRLGGDPDKRKTTRRLQEPKGEFIMKKFLESTAINQPEDAKRPLRQPLKLKRKDEQNQTRPRNYLFDLNRPSVSAIYPEGCVLRLPHDEVSIETNKRRAKNKCKGGAKPKQKTVEAAKDGPAKLRPKKGSKVEETLTTISSYCDHILKTVKADYTTYIPTHLRNKTTERSDLKPDLSVTTFIDGSRIEKCGENPLLSDDSLKKTRHVDAELTSTRNVAKKQFKKKPDLKTLSFIHINPMYINEDKPRCYPTFWCFPEINKQPRDCRDLRSSSNQSASSDEIQEGEGNSPDSQEAGGNSPNTSNRTSPSASSSNRIHRNSPNVANSSYIQSQGGAASYSPSSRADGVSLIFKGARDSPNLSGTVQAGVNLKYKLRDSLSFEPRKKLKTEAAAGVSPFNVDGNFEARDSPNARVSPFFKVGTNSEPNARIFPTFKYYSPPSEVDANSDESRASFRRTSYSPPFEIDASSENLRAGFETTAGFSPTFGYSPDARSSLEAAVNSKYNSPSFVLGGSSKKFASPDGSALKIAGSFPFNETRDPPSARSSVNSPSFELGGNSKKYESADENSRTNGARDSPTRVCNSPYFGLSKSRLLRVAGVSPTLKIDGYDSPNTRSAVFNPNTAETKASEHYSSAEESDLIRGGFETNAGGFPTFIADVAAQARDSPFQSDNYGTQGACDSPDSTTQRACDAPDSRTQRVCDAPDSRTQPACDSPDLRNALEVDVDLNVRLRDSPSKFDRKRARHSLETSPIVDGNSLDVKVCDSPSLGLDGNSKKSTASDFKIDADLVQANSPNAGSTVEDSNSIQSQRDAGFDVGENPNANVNRLEANTCDSPIGRNTAADSNSVRSRGGAPSFDNSSSNANCAEASIRDSPSFKTQLKKEGEQSKLALRPLNYDGRLKLEINKRLRRQAEEEYTMRNSFGQPQASTKQKSEWLQVRETKTGDVTQQIQNYTLFLQKLASQFDCLMQEDLVLGGLVAFPEAERNEEGASPTFDDDVGLIEELYSKRDDVERGPEEAAQLDQEILDLGRKIILKYVTPSKREKPLHRLLEECGKRRFERQVLEEQLLKEADFILLPTTPENIGANEDDEVPGDKETETRRGNEESFQKLKGNEEECFQKLRGNEEECLKKLRGNEEESFQKLRRNEEECFPKLRGNEEECLQKLRGNEEESFQKLRGNEEESCQTSSAKLRGNEEESSQTSQGEYTPKELMDMIDSLYEKRDGMLLRGNEDTEALNQQISELEFRIIRRSSVRQKLIDLMQAYKSAQSKDNQSNAELRKPIREMIVEEMEKDDSVKILYDKKVCLEDSEECFLSPRKPSPNLNLNSKLGTLKESSGLNVKNESHEHVLNWKLYLTHRNLPKLSSNEERPRKNVEGCIPKKQVATAKKKKTIKSEFRAQRTQSEREGAACKLKESNFDKRFKIEECESVIKIDEVIKEEDDAKPDFFRRPSVREKTEESGKGRRVIEENDVREKEESGTRWRLIEDVEEKEENGRRWRLIDERVGGKEESDRRRRRLVEEDVKAKEESNGKWRPIEAEDLRIKTRRIEESDWIEKPRSTGEGARGALKESQKQIEDAERIEDREHLQVEGVEENQGSRGFNEENRLGIIEENQQQIEESQLKTEETLPRTSNFQIEEEEDEQKIKDSRARRIEDIEESELQIEEAEAECVTTSRAAGLQFQAEEENSSEEKLEEAETLVRTTQLQIEEEEESQSITKLPEAEDTRSAFEEIELQVEELGEENRPRIEDVEESELQIEESEAECVTTSRVAGLQLQAEEENGHSRDSSEENKLQREEAETLLRTTQLQIEEEEESPCITRLPEAEDTRSAFEEIELQVEELAEENRPQIEESELQIEETEIQSVTRLQAEDTRSAKEELSEDFEEEETEVLNAPKLQTEDTWTTNEESEDAVEEISGTTGTQQNEETLSTDEENHELQVEETRSVTEESERGVIKVEETRGLTEETPLAVVKLRIEETLSATEGHDEVQPLGLGLTGETPLAVAKLRIEEALEEHGVVQPLGLTEETNLAVAKLRIEETWTASSEEHDEVQPRGLTGAKSRIEDPQADNGEDVIPIEETQANEEPRGLTERTPSVLTKQQVEETCAVLKDTDTSSVRKLRDEETRAVSEGEPLDDIQPRGVIEESGVRPQRNEFIEEKQIEDAFGDTDDKQSLSAIEETPRDNEEKLPRLQIEDTWAVLEDTDDKQSPSAIEESVARPRDNEEKLPHLQIEDTRAVLEDTDGEQSQGAIEESVTRLRGCVTEETGAVSGDTGKKQPKIEEAQEGVTADEESVMADEVSCSTQPLEVVEEQLQIEDNVLSECTDTSDGGQDKSEEYHDFIDLDGIADIQNELLDNVFYDAQVKVEETTEINGQQSESAAGKSGELKAPKTKKSFPSLSKLGKKAKKDSNCKIS